MRRFRDWRKKCAAFGDKLIEACQDGEDAYPNAYLDRLAGIFFESPEPAAEVLFFRGSLLMSMVPVYYYSSRCLPRELCPEFDRMAREELIDTIGLLKDMSGELLSEIET